MAMVWKSKTGRINKVLLAGETILVGQALCIKDTESTVKLADSDAVGGALMPCIGFAGNGASIGGPVEVVTEGLLSGVDTPAEGRSVFVSATAGAVDQTGGTYQQLVGTALTSTLMEVSVWNVQDDLTTAAGTPQVATPSDTSIADNAVVGVQLTQTGPGATTGGFVVLTFKVAHVA